VGDTDRDLTQMYSDVLGKKLPHEANGLCARGSESSSSGGRRPGAGHVALNSHIRGKLKKLHVIRSSRANNFTSGTCHLSYVTNKTQIC
jgi:hypothetical protein